MLVSRNSNAHGARRRFSTMQLPCSWRAMPMLVARGVRDRLLANDGTRIEKILNLTDLQRENLLQQ
jgi:hypothetical protein